MTTPVRYMTAEELERRSEEHPRAELWDGVLFVRGPTTPWHGAAGASITARLHSHVEPRRLGWVLDSSAGFLVARNPDRVLEPDASYTSLERMPTLPKRGFPEVAPDLVVEIRSPESSWHEQYAKGVVWIGHGVRVVWLVNPPARQAVVLRDGASPVVVGEEGLLDAAPVLDLRIPLRDVLRGLP